MRPNQWAIFRKKSKKLRPTLKYISPKWRNMPSLVTLALIYSFDLGSSSQKKRWHAAEQVNLRMLRKDRHEFLFSKGFVRILFEFCCRVFCSNFVVAFLFEFYCRGFC
jgi:hypothetical protein